MLLKIYFMDDFECEVDAPLDPHRYRLVERIPLLELGNGILAAAANLIILSRAPRWYELGNGRRPVRAGDVLKIGEDNYMYSRAKGAVLPDCTLRLNKLEKSIL